MLLDSYETKKLLLDEFLQVCTFTGWNENALMKAAKNCNIEEKFISLIFENGCLDLAKFYIEEQNKIAAKKILEIPSTEKIRNKIRFALYARFEVEQNNKIALQRLINFFLNPKNFTSLEMGPRPALQALKTCYTIADSIWTNINDQSTDFNYYTKRITLAKIILRSLFIFLKDESENFSKTKNFIDSQIEKVMKFEKCKAKVKNIFAEIKNKSPQEIIRSLPFIRLIKF